VVLLCLVAMSAAGVAAATWLAALVLVWSLAALVLISIWGATEASAAVVVGSFTFIVGSLAWVAGPRADVQWLLLSNVVVFFLVFEERYPRTRAVAVALNTACFAALAWMEAAGTWTGSLPTGWDEAARWPVRLAVLADVLGLLRHFARNERRYERATRLARDEGWRAAGEREAFIAEMCHEIRTPLMALSHIHETLLRSSLPADDRPLVEQAVNAGDHLMSVLSDALDLARVDAGRLDVDVQAHDLSEVVGEVVGLANAMARSRALRLMVDVQLGGRSIRMFDRRRLTQVLLNLISNAIKFTERGEVLVTVRRGVGDAVEFRIRDEGLGMSVEEVERVFRAFEQAAPSSADRFRGAGLGLAISHRLVQAFGGQLEVSSDPGRGSELRFTLVMPSSDQITEEPEPEPTMDDVGRLRVLLVEDMVVNQWVVRRMLEAMGFEVEVVADGRSAVDTWRRTRPDIVLMDLHLPVMDGLEATRAIRELELPGRPPVPIVALTAAAMPSEVEQCLRAGMNDHVAKPARQEDLQRAITRAVLRARANVHRIERLQVSHVSGGMLVD
jgi:signal transduction histidine kinase/AmiR/NasT family two-component response regulator